MRRLVVFFLVAIATTCFCKPELTEDERARLETLLGDLEADLEERKVGLDQGNVEGNEEFEREEDFEPGEFDQEQFEEGRDIELDEQIELVAREGEDAAEAKEAVAMNKVDAAKAAPSKLLPVKPPIFLPWNRDPCAGHACCDKRVATFDLTTGRKFFGPQGVYLSRHFSKPTDRKCAVNGQIRVNFEAFTEKPCNACMSTPFFGRRMLKLEFDMHPSSRGKWLFGIGDSSTNDGYGGDANTELYDAEADGLYPHIYTYTNDICKREHGMQNAFKRFDNALSMQVRKVTVFIANGYIRVVSGNTDQSTCSKCLWGLNNQNKNSNRDVYISFNSVVRPNYNGRYGYGLCRARVSWVCPDTIGN